MANTWSFFPDASVVIKAALRRIRGYDPEDATTITTVQYNNALETMNFLISSWQAFGLQVWCRKISSNLTLIANQGIYTVGSAGADLTLQRPVQIIQAYLRDVSVTPNVDLPQMELIGTNRYHAIPNKQVQALPLQLYYAANWDGASNTGTNAKGTIYLWPYPDSTTATNRRLILVYQRPLEDFDATTDALDMPQEWFEALRLNLAHKIAPEYGLPVMEQDRLKTEAEEALELAKSSDSDFDSMFLQPNLRNWAK